MMNNFLQAALALSAGLVLYTYFGYPLVLVLLTNFKQLVADIRFAAVKRNRRRSRCSPELPKVSLVFAAHNEAPVIGWKMRNCKHLNYPADRLEILVGCDGCTDRTATLARQANVPNARILEILNRGGKPATLNLVVPLAQGDIIVLCDSNTMFEPDTLMFLVRHFEERNVGCVCGELRLVDGSQKGSSENLYWKYETMLKFLESRLNMLVGANGGIFAIRRELFTPLPPDGIIDDFLVAMRIRAAGHRVIYDPEAVASEELAEGVRHEFRRRIRIGAGNFHALKYTWKLLNPTMGWVALSYWSHKVFRWVVPLALCIAEASAILLASDVRYAALAAVGVLIVGLGLAGYRLDLRGVHWAPCSLPYYFLSMNLALLLGFVRFLRQSQSTVWKPTPRPSFSPIHADPEDAGLAPEDGPRFKGARV
ncbi:MAG: glycosyltransferase family 2 protein [Acidobacteriia bacterium]|nr:glycosyltransferase family 2 protein [Terriglobia bacterium]